MRVSTARTVFLYLCWVGLSGCRACGSKTPVPFKRALPDASVAQDASSPLTAADPANDVAQYPEGTQKVVFGDTQVERSSGTIYAASARDLNADEQPDVLTLSSDDDGNAVVEVTPHGANAPSAKLELSPEPIGRGCKVVGGQLALLGAELGVASVSFLCEARAAAPLSTSAVAEPAAAALPSEPPAPTDLPPPEPDAVIAQTQHFVFSLGMNPQKRLRLYADWTRETAPISPELQLSGSDVDGDQLADVHVELPPAGEASQLAGIKLTWLNRTAGLARDREEPEASLMAGATAASRALTKKPEQAVTDATEVFRLHQLLCKESGAARLWVDDARGLPCGPSNAAGLALATSAIGRARQQHLLPALEARGVLDRSSSVYAVDKKTRDQVSAAIGAIRGDTNYRWHMGPTLSTASLPSLHLPALGFIDENSLLLRGPVAQSYDLQNRTSTPTGIPGSALASDAAQRFVLTDIVRGCDGYRVRVVPANGVIGGIVTGAVSSEPLLQPSTDGADASECKPGARAHSDHGGFVMVGLNSAGALFARGKQLWLLPLDARGDATGPARLISPSERIPPLVTPSALDQSARYLALATSEGVALIDRVHDSARLIRTPASCAGGRVSDAVVSPSGTKLAMLCSGRVYVAEPAADDNARGTP